MKKYSAVLFASACLFITAGHSFSEPVAADGAAITATAEDFHKALRRGDGQAAMDLLAPDAMILESGSAETRTEYEQHHLQEDIAFARKVESARRVLSVRREGDAAWMISVSLTRGSFRNHEIDSEGTELAVLTKSPQGWRIRAIHWSSHEPKRE
jgi:ketosteroid isomerase-like protein